MRDTYYDSSPLRRTLKELQECAQKSKGENYCCVDQPLLNISLDHIILDELHLMVQVTDVLIGNIIEGVMQWDEKESFLTPTGKKKIHLDKLTQAINSCGYHFQFGKNEMQMAQGLALGTGQL